MDPFNPSTTLRFDLTAACPVRLEVFDTAGRLVRTLVDESHSAGSYAVTFDGSELPSGIYFARLEASGLRQPRLQEVQKLVLVK